MTSRPPDDVPRHGAPMTPERWRVVDAILRGALASERDRRDDFVRDACGDDEALRREVESLLAAHDGMADDFLEMPAPEVFASTTPPPATERRIAALAAALGGHYAIERELARGGMATVYLARDLRHDRRVAIKVMRDEVAEAVGAERFLEEIRVTASLQHPHILPLFDSGRGDGLLWYVMPYVEGETLRSRLAREGRLPLDDATRLATEMADALAYAHARGIVHRDVKPENVLLQGGHALVADFGIALALEKAGGERLTRTGLALGTPQYMAPEQALGERVIDARVDVYALGAVTYEMLVGEPPFAATSRQAVMQRVLHVSPAAVALRRREVSPALDAAIARALAKRPAERFPSAAAFAAALVASPDAAGSTAPAPDVYEMPSLPSGRRVVAAHMLVYAAIVGIVIGLVTGLGLRRTSVLDRLTDGARGAPQPAAAANAGGPSLVVVDRAGKVQQTIAANRPWTPRFSPIGNRVAYGAFGPGRNTSDLWVTDLDVGTTVRLTDDDGDSNDPQWNPQGGLLAFSVNAPGGKDVAVRMPNGRTRVLAARDGTQFPSDWLHDGSALIVTEGPEGHEDIIVQPADGSDAHPYVATEADERSARVSPDERWIAYTSNESGPDEVYLDSYPRSRQRIKVSKAGGIDPVWRGDGKELYFWRGDSLIAVKIDAARRGGPPAVGAETVLFGAPYQPGLNTMYDVRADGQRFVIVRRG